MAELAGETVVAIDKLSVDDDSAAHACAKSDHDEILQSACGAVGHLADGGGVSVIGNGNGHTHLFRKHLGEGYGRWPG